MAVVNTLYCNTSGNVAAITATALTDPMTGNAAFLPMGASVSSVVLYRDGNSTVTSGASIQLGIVGNNSRYVNLVDGITSTQLNNGETVTKMMNVETGLTAESELRIYLTNALNTGSISFKITYNTFT
jgi:hypothetical protein